MNIFTTNATSTSRQPQTLTREMVEEVMALMPPKPKKLFLNPNLCIPLGTGERLEDLQGSGNLPSNILLNRVVPLLMAYEIDEEYLKPQFMSIKTPIVDWR